MHGHWPELGCGAWRLQQKQLFTALNLSDWFKYFRPKRLQLEIWKNLNGLWLKSKKKKFFFEKPYTTSRFNSIEHGRLHQSTQWRDRANWNGWMSTFADADECQSNNIPTWSRPTVWVGPYWNSSNSGGRLIVFCHKHGRAFIVRAK